MSNLVITHGAVQRGRRTVLQANSFSVSSPAALAVVGVNGSGKTSLFMCLTGTLARSSCSVVLSERRPSVAWVPQNAPLPAWLDAPTIARLYGLDWDFLCSSMPQLHLDELSGQTSARLSIGQRQALAIAIALGRDADLILLDEPFSALDFRRRAAVLEVLRTRLALPDRALVLTSQSAADLRDVCSHYLVLRDGRSVFEGSRAALTGGDPDAAAVERRLLELLG